MTGNTSHTMATYRLSVNAFPNAAITSCRSRPLANPVATPATVTTRSGFNRMANPTITISTPIKTIIRETECSSSANAVAHKRRFEACFHRRPLIVDNAEVDRVTIGTVLLNHVFSEGPLLGCAYPENGRTRFYIF